MAEPGQGRGAEEGKGSEALQPGIGATQLGFPGRTNPVGAGFSLGPAYAFGFATAIPGTEGPRMTDTDLSASPLKAGTRLVLRFGKAATDHVSFVAMLADAADLGNIGVKVLSPTELEVRATIVDPIVSERNNPDVVGASFGLIMQTTDSPDETFSFRGTTFVTNMHWLDLEPLALTELPQLSPDVDVSGFAAGIAARGVSSVAGNRADFTAYMPEALFAFARSRGVEVTGEECLGYRAYVELTGGEDGFFRLNDPPSQPQADANFDVDGDGAPDPMWRYRISNAQWSRQPFLFGMVKESPPVPTGVGEATWGDLKGTSR